MQQIDPSFDIRISHIWKKPCGCCDRQPSPRRNATPPPILPPLIIFGPSINGQLDTPGRFDAVAPRVQDIDKFVHMVPSHHSGAEVLSSGAAVVASARIINAAARHKVGIVPVLDLLVKQQ